MDGSSLTLTDRAGTKDFGAIGANLFGAKLSGANLTGADVAGADFTEVDLDGTILKNVRGLGTAKGMENATNRDRAIH